MDLQTSLELSFAGMDAQGTRLRVIAGNLANADSTSQTPGGAPYQRQVVTFKSVLDRSLGAETVKVAHIEPAGGTFQRKYDPGNPGADAQGYVLMPNVNPLVEMMDMREASRTYQANVDAITAAKSMISRTIDLLRS
ncbi:MAG TPA: flagellar basal body rod protein FlgC [Stellaceae bacterium]|jgi:flagellar basal-body rod protein FlgC|nr:flagellar basal body rod protein FlgC [Stellaceae bacterium]